MEKNYYLLSYIQINASSPTPLIAVCCVVGNFKEFVNLKRKLSNDAKWDNVDFYPILK